MTQSPTERAKGILPVNKVVTTIETEAVVKDAVATLVAAGFAENEIFIHHGEQGEQYLDLDGSEQGFIGRLVRSYQRLQGVEKHMFDDAETALKSGHYLVGVQTNGTEEQQVQARDALTVHTPHNVYFCGRFTITFLAVMKRS
ncbi:MAG: hypothetical protein ACPG8W_14310 [Candidatus Promineifilaceae bacterium]